MATTPPGWYDDGHGALRWWDGSVWTEHVATPDPEPAADSPAPVAPYEAPYETPTTAYPDLSHGGYPQGYPGAYPGGGAPTGAFVSATEPRRSKLWIVWVVLGVVLLGIVVALTVLIPLLLMGAATGGSGGAEPSPRPQSSGEVAADEDAAVAAVELYDEAWREADCESYFASTTEAFRTLIELPDCESFYTQARGYMSSISDFEMTIREVETIGSSVAVSTTESYTSSYDADGNETAEPQHYEDRYEYFVVEDGGVWAIDDSFLD